VRSRGLCVDLPHPVLGSVPSVACPIRFSETPVQYRHAAPSLGQHSRQAMTDANASASSHPESQENTA